jgi:hypothetical protein
MKKFKIYQISSTKEEKSVGKDQKFSPIDSARQEFQNEYHILWF